MMKMKITCGLLFFFLLTIHILQGRISNETKTSQRDFGFGAMEIFEFSNLTSNLQVYDMNMDGLDDILFLNNEVSRLEILIRKKTAANRNTLPALFELFTNKGFVLDKWVQNFQVDDMNRDNHPDIVTLDNQHGIQIYFQQENGTFGEPVSLYIKEASKLKGFKTADLNGDNHIDILLYRQENAEIITNNGNGEFKSHSMIHFSPYGCRGVIISDINGDNILDLLLYFPKEELPLRIRRGKGNGQFGWEEALPLPDIQAIEQLDLPGSGSSRMAVILKNGLVLRIYGFESKTGERLIDGGEVIARRLSLKGISRKRVPSWAAADINRDSYMDFCVAAPLLNQIHIYKGSTSGLSFSPITIDSLRDIKTMAITGRGDLAVFSEAEKAIAVHINSSLTTFPKFLKAAGEPVAMAAAGESTIFTLFKNKKFILHLFNSQSPGAAPFESFQLGIRNKPLEMKVFPLDGENHWGAIFFMPYDKPVMYRLKKGKLIEVTPEHFRTIGLSLKPQELNVVGSKEKQVLLVAEGNVARLYRWEEDKFVVEAQLNPRIKSARLSTGCRFSDIDKGYLLYDNAGHYLYRFFAGSSKKITRMHVKGGIKDLIGLTVLRFKENQGILLVGQSEIQWLQKGIPSLYLKNMSEYTSRMERPSIWTLVPVSLGSPGRQMLALLDANNRSVELVSIKEGKLVEELVFEVFQNPGFNDRISENIYEPHDLRTGDFNGDNIMDMAILVHNKLIIYLGE